MAWTQTSATDIDDLQAQLRTFLLANGWTSGGATIVVNSDGYKFRCTANKTITRNSYPFTDPDVPDYYFNVEFDQTVLGGAGYSTLAGGVNLSNDFAGPFPNVWFFTDGAYCHVAAQVASNRYSHISFGSLDGKGMSPHPIAFIAGMFYYWWRENLLYSGGAAGNDNAYKTNNPSNGSHEYGHLAQPSQSYVAIPDNVADDTLNFASGAIFDPTLNMLLDFLTFHGNAADGNAWGRTLGFLPSIENKAITGGVPIIPVPWIAYGTANEQLFLGELPNFGVCKLNGLSPAQTIEYSGDEWIVFPFKQKGTEAATRYGATPQPDCNTVEYGFAYKKV